MFTPLWSYMPSPPPFGLADSVVASGDAGVDAAVMEGGAFLDLLEGEDIAAASLLPLPVPGLTPPIFPADKSSAEAEEAPDDGASGLSPPFTDLRPALVQEPARNSSVPEGPNGAPALPSDSILRPSEAIQTGGPKAIETQGSPPPPAELASETPQIPMQPADSSANPAPAPRQSPLEPSRKAHLSGPEPRAAEPPNAANLLLAGQTLPATGGLSDSLITRRISAEVGNNTAFVDQKAGKIAPAGSGAASDAAISEVMIAAPSSPSTETAFRLRVTEAQTEPAVGGTITGLSEPRPGPIPPASIAPGTPRPATASPPLQRALALPLDSSPAPLDPNATNTLTEFPTPRVAGLAHGAVSPPKLPLDASSTKVGRTLTAPPSSDTKAATTDAQTEPPSIPLAFDHRDGKERISTIQPLPVPASASEVAVPIAPHPTHSEAPSRSVSQAAPVMAGRHPLQVLRQPGAPDRPPPVDTVDFAAIPSTFSKTDGRSSTLSDDVPISAQLNLAPPPSALHSPTQPGLSGPLALHQIAQTLITSTSQSGQIEVILNPEDLGRLRFDLQPVGDRVHVVLSAERPETMDLLRRHAPDLIAELKASGYSGASLSFGQWGGGEARSQSRPTFFSEAAENAPDSPLAPAPTSAKRTVSTGGIDLRF